MDGIHAKKSLGQNFLKSKTALLAMVKAGEIVKSDIVLEIGPGKGALTEKLLETGAKVIAVEKDDRLIEVLNEKFAVEKNSGQFELIHGDILEIDIEKELKTRGRTLNSNSQGSTSVFTPHFKLIANIPYYITGLIFRKFLEEGPQPEKIVILVQKEIADRIVARDGKESLLSISVKVYGNPKKIMKVEKENFSPAPKVDSAILLIDNVSKNFFADINEKAFFELLKAGFAHKRKVLISNLKSLAEKSGKNLSKIFPTLGIPEKARAEDLTIETWQKLTKAMI